MKRDCRRAVRGCGGVRGTFGADRRAGGAGVEALESRVLLAGTPIISEFMASNSLTRDVDGDTSDWIEIHNPLASSLNLDGYYLSDDPSGADKWRLPGQVIPAGGYLVVFASGKDRAVVGQQLHTDFSLEASGGHLALIAPDGATAVHQYAPYPEQLTNLSYGVSVQREESVLIGPGGSLKYHVPSGPLAADWAARGFDDSTWGSGTSGIGYDINTPPQPVAGFAVRMIDTVGGDLGNIGVATNLLNGNTAGFVMASDTAGTRSHVNFGDAGAFTANAQRLPNDPNGAFAGNNGAAEREQYALRAAADVVIPAGTYTVNVASDDGFRLHIPGVTFTGRVNENHSGATNPSPADTLVFGAPRGHSNTLATFTVGSPLTTMVMLDFYERTGGDSLELSVASGAQGGFSTGAFALLADGVLGWQVRSLPPVSQPDFNPMIVTNVQGQMAGQASTLYVRMPFAFDEADHGESVKLKIRYEDGFAAYLNGQFLTSRNAPASAQWDSSSLAARADADGLIAEEITVDVPASLLVAGQNVLAIHGLNFGASSSDFLLTAELIGLGTPFSGDRYFAAATPGAANPASDLTASVADTTFSHDRGFYTNGFNLTIATETPGATIRYTLDGSPPTATTGSVYTGPIAINRTSVVRAAAFKPGSIPSNVDTQTYLFVNDVPGQTHQSTLAAGFPSSWGGTSPDYGMDPEVVGPNDLFGGVYASSIRSDLKAIPTLSIVTSADGMFGPGGIYTNSTQSGAAWERPTSVELLMPDGSEGFQIDAGIRIQGGAFRSHGLTRKHSLRLLFKNQYGAGKLDFPLFGIGTGAADSFDTITLRSEANDGWQWSSAGTRPLYARDEFGRRTQLATGQVGSHGTNMHVYINGVYWGMYNPVERPDAAFGATYYGGEKEDWDAVNSGEAVDGNLNAWNAMMNVANEVATATTESARTAGYMKIQGLNPDGTRNPAYPVLLDVDNLIDYMIVNLYMGNSDWPSHNWYAARDRRPESTGYKFFMWDAEWTLGLNSDVNANRVDVNIGPALAYSRLRASSEFRMRFADRMQKHFFDGGALYVDAANPQWDPAHPERNVPAARMVEIANGIREAIVAESARWGDQHRGTPPYTRADWEGELNRILTSYFPQRSGIVINQFTTAGLFVNQATVRAPVFSQNGGDVPAGFGLTISNTGPAGEIWYTLDGSDPRPIGGGAPAAGAIRYTGVVSINESAVLKARVRLANGTWSPLNEKAFAVPLTTLKVSELMYHAPVPAGSPYIEGDFDFVELVNTGATPLSLRGLTFTSGITFTFPNSAPTLAPGARTVVVRNLAAFRSRYGDAVPVAGVFGGSLSDSGETLALAGRAGETVFSFEYEDWYDITDGGGYSLVAIDPAATTDAQLSTKAAWRPSNLAGGGPGVVDPGINPGAVVINEVMANATGPAGDWVELYNASPSVMDVSGWFISDSAADLQKHVIPAGTVIQPGGYALVHLAFDVSAVSADLHLANSDGAGALAGYRDLVDFAGSPEDVTFGRFVTGSGVDFTALARPTPLAENAGAVVGPVVINELMYDPPAGKHEFIELRNVTAASVPLPGWTFTSAINFTFDAGASIPAFGYALVVPIDPALFRSTYNVPTGVPIYGPYTGALDNAGEDVKLSRPGNAAGSLTPLVLVDKVKYDDALPWPNVPGASLARVSASAYGNDAANWVAGADGGTPGLRNFPELAPVVDVGPDAVINAGGTLQRTGAFHDPDAGKSWSVMLDPGDGSGPRPVAFNGSKAFTFSHAYPAAGMYTVTVTVSDGFFTASDTMEVAVLPGPLLGTAAADTWAVKLDPGGTLVLVDQNGARVLTLPLSAVGSLSIMGLGGDDTLNVEASLDGGVVFDGGAGENVVLTGGAGVKLVLEGDSQVTLEGSLDLESLTLNGMARAALPARGSVGSGAAYLRVRDLAIGAQARLDLADRGMVIQAASAPEAPAKLSQVEGLIRTARGTAWIGSGLSSSAAAAETRGITGLGAILNRSASGAPLVTSWHGHAVDAHSVLVGYAYEGDSDLDGVVDGDDLMRADRGFLSRVDANAGNDLAGYGNGDVNADGRINISDLFLIDRARSMQGGALGAAAVPPVELFGPVIEDGGFDFAVESAAVLSEQD